MDYLKHFPVEIIYGAVAIAGGCARYLNSYTKGSNFSLKIFIASAFVSGFSGYMFALLGDSLHLPYPMSHIMAGVGGFFGDQTMKLVMESINSKLT